MKRGFTLIELLVVVAIIGVLASVILVSLNASRVKANDARRVSDLREVQKAVENYALDNYGSYPSTGGSFRSQCSGFGSYPASSVVPGLPPTYISALSADPQMNIAANTCCYTYVSDGVDYDFMDWACSTANLSNSALTSLKDPGYPSGWSVHSAGAAAKGW